MMPEQNRETMKAPSSFLVQTTADAKVLELVRK